MLMLREVFVLYDFVVGVVVFWENFVFVVYEKDCWGLLKGGFEFGEFFFEIVVCEVVEEIGVEVEI